MAASLRNRNVCNVWITRQHKAPRRLQLTAEAVYVTRDGGWCHKAEHSAPPERAGGTEIKKLSDETLWCKLCLALALARMDNFKKCGTVWRHAFWATNCVTHKYFDKMKRKKYITKKMYQIRYLYFFRYFGIMKVGLCNYHVICLPANTPKNFQRTEIIFMKLIYHGTSAYLNSVLQLSLQQVPPCALKWTNFKPTASTINKKFWKEHANRWICLRDSIYSCCNFKFGF
jgi:hypothetical protein